MGGGSSRGGGGLWEGRADGGVGVHVEDAGGATGGKQAGGRGRRSESCGHPPVGLRRLHWKPDRQTRGRRDAALASDEPGHFLVFENFRHERGRGWEWHRPPCEWPETPQRLVGLRVWGAAAPAGPLQGGGHGDW